MMMLFTSMNILAKETAAPDMALLEFIGESVKVGDDMVDPMSWQAMQDMTAKQQGQRQHDRQQQSAGHKQDQQNGRQPHD